MNLPFPMSPHVARHTFGSMVYKNSKDILLTQKALRHTSINSTMIYVHMASEASKEADKILDLFD